MHILVPEELVARLIGKHGENVKHLSSRTRCHVSFCKTEDRGYLTTSEGIYGRICTVKGSAEELTKGVCSVVEQMFKYETNTY
jgi:hypothetical protein